MRREFLLRKPWLWLCVAALLLLQAVLGLTLVHRETLTWDEGDHTFAGYMMWKTGDYGLNPEHPPLVKLLATLPVLHNRLWIPPLQGRDFKTEAYLDGRDWLARNDGASQRLLFRMRMAAELLALLLGLTVFLAARRWFGPAAGLLALALLAFDPNILTNSGLVTTDIGVSLFFVASVFAFYRWVTAPGWTRLLVAGIMVGLLLATKHSGILIAPMLLFLAAYELFRAARGQRLALARRLVLGFCAITVVSVLVLWSFYGFRYRSRPSPMQLSTSLADYAAPLPPLDRGVVMAIAHAHLLPESYLMGLVDVKRMAAFYPMYLLGQVHAHGVWWYFPVVLLVKTTLGLLALVALAFYAWASRALRRDREVVYVLAPAAIYLAIAMASGMNIGARHLLPVYALLTIFAAAGAVSLSRRGRPWAVAVGVLAAAQIVESMAAYPNEMAFANAAWGGPSHSYRLLSDSSVDWAQQLYQVKQWEDRHPGTQCWFAYFAGPETEPATYGIRCHVLPTADTLSMGGAQPTPPEIDGTVLVSAGTLSGCEWPSGDLNPYRGFQSLRPVKVIDDSVFVYRGRFDTRNLAALAQASIAAQLLAGRQIPQALAAAQAGVGYDPENVPAQTALGDAAAAAGDKPLARQAYEAAIALLGRMDQGAREGDLGDLKKKLAAVS